MITIDESAGPEGKTPSAPFDPVPLEVLNWGIDRQDMLAWLALPHEMRGREKAVYLGFLIAAGMGFALVEEHLPDWMLAVPYPLMLLGVVGLAHLLWLITSNLWLRIEARRRMPRPITCRLADHGDHLEVAEGGRRRFIALEMIRQVLLTETRVFIDEEGGPIILPLSAFPGGRAGMAAFAGNLDARSAASAE